MRGGEGDSDADGAVVAEAACIVRVGRLENRLMNAEKPRQPRGSAPPQPIDSRLEIPRLRIMAIWGSFKFDQLAE